MKLSRREYRRSHSFQRLGTFLVSHIDTLPRSGELYKSSNVLMDREAESAISQIEGLRSIFIRPGIPVVDTLESNVRINVFEPRSTASGARERRILNDSKYKLHNRRFSASRRRSRNPPTRRPSRRPRNDISNSRSKHHRDRRRRYIIQTSCHVIINCFYKYSHSFHRGYLHSAPEAFELFKSSNCFFLTSNSFLYSSVLAMTCFSTSSSRAISSASLRLPTVKYFTVPRGRYCRR